MGTLNFQSDDAPLAQSQYGINFGDTSSELLFQTPEKMESPNKAKGMVNPSLSTSLLSSEKKSVTFHPKLVTNGNSSNLNNNFSESN